MSLAAEARNFRMAKEREQQDAAQLVALFLACGIDMEDALCAAGERRQRIVTRLRRLLERERLRGQRRHWSYDLNRHIALKQTLDRLRGQSSRTASRGETAKAKGGAQAPSRRNG